MVGGYSNEESIELREFLRRTQNQTARAMRITIAMQTAIVPAKRSGRDGRDTKNAATGFKVGGRSVVVALGLNGGSVGTTSSPSVSDISKWLCSCTNTVNFI